VDQLLAAQLSPTEAAALRAFDQSFEAFAATDLTALALRTPEAIAAERGHLVEIALELQRQTLASADLVAASAARVRDATQRTAVGVGVAAVVVSALLIWWAVRSLRARLDQLILGTQAVSNGTLSVQLEVGDDELGQVAESFNRMVGALQQFERLKVDFISSVSHELRNPLVATQETTRLLLDEVVGPLTPKQRQMLELSAQAAERLSKMISDLLELSRLNAGLRYSMAEHDLVRLTRASVLELEAVALEHGLELRTRIEEASLLAPCDADRYVQLVQNLVGNAIRYTPSGGVIEVGLARLPAISSKATPAGEPARDCALLAVEDSGPGVPEEDRERVFEKFFRRDGVPSDGGVGLGLAIGREIVEAHGGNVWVDASARLGGAAFFVVLPIGPSANAPARGSAGGRPWRAG
ncbi:MAG: ATP-binding protein, partial [Kofleriaceae bacterium]